MINLMGIASIISAISSLIAAWKSHSASTNAAVAANMSITNHAVLTKMQPVIEQAVKAK